MRKTTAKGSCLHGSAAVTHLYIDACVIMKATQNIYDTNKYTSFDVQPDMRLPGEPIRLRCAMLAHRSI